MADARARVLSKVATRRSHLNGSAAQRIPHNTHRILPPVGSGDPSLVLTGAGARDGVAMPLEQSLGAVLEIVNHLDEQHAAEGCVWIGLPDFADFAVHVSMCKPPAKPGKVEKVPTLRCGC